MGSLTESFRNITSEIKACSLRPYVLATGCCSVEFESVRSAVYDWSRLGIFEAKEPCEADVLIVSGWINPEMQRKVLKVYNEMNSPKYVIAVGACAVSGSPYNFGEKRPVLLSDFLPVNIYVPGCPPRPELLIEGLLSLQKQVGPTKDQREILQAAMKTGPV